MPPAHGIPAAIAVVEAGRPLRGQLRTATQSALHCEKSVCAARTDSSLILRMCKLILAGGKSTPQQGDGFVFLPSKDYATEQELMQSLVNICCNPDSVLYTDVSASHALLHVALYSKAAARHQFIATAMLSAFSCHQTKLPPFLENWYGYVLHMEYL